MSSAHEWYCETEAGVIGPLLKAELRELMESGRGQRIVLRIRKGENGSWLPADQIRSALGLVEETESVSDVIDESADYYFSAQDRRKMGPVSWTELATMAR